MTLNSFRCPFKFGIWMLHLKGHIWCIHYFNMWVHWGCPWFNPPSMGGSGGRVPIVFLDDKWRAICPFPSTARAQAHPRLRQRYIPTWTLEWDLRNTKKKQSQNCFWCHAAATASSSGNDDPQCKALTAVVCVPGQTAIVAWLPDTLNLICLPTLPLQVPMNY